MRSATTAVCTRSPRYLGKTHAAADRADLVAGAADPLQPARHRRRRLDLHHEVDRAHVDAELEADGGDHGGQPAGLELLLDQRALLAWLTEPWCARASTVGGAAGSRPPGP